MSGKKIEEVTFFFSHVFRENWKCFSVTIDVNNFNFLGILPTHSLNNNKKKKKNIIQEYIFYCEKGKSLTDFLLYFDSFLSTLYFSIILYIVPLLSK